MTAEKKRRRTQIDGVYTTGRAARICRLSQQIIIHCFDKGMFKGGFRLPTGTRHRRIPKTALEQFIKENGIILE